LPLCDGQKRGMGGQPRIVCVFSALGALSRAGAARDHGSMITSLAAQQLGPLDAQCIRRPADNLQARVIRTLFERSRRDRPSDRSAQAMIFGRSTNFIIAG
jgi:hypothetical protein